MYDRVAQWKHFSHQVEKHIIEYTLPQYGNADGNEQVDSFTLDQIKSQIQRYTNRMGKNARGPLEDLRDMLKIAHYAQFAYDKLADQYLANVYEVEETE